MSLLIFLIVEGTPDRHFFACKENKWLQLNLTDVTVQTIPINVAVLVTWALAVVTSVSILRLKMYRFSERLAVNSNKRRSHLHVQ